MSSSSKSTDFQNFEVRSEWAPSSSSSHNSTRSGVSLAAVEARAKAEAARTKADYTKRQIEMKVERARLDAMLAALQEEGEAESALAAAKTLEAAAETEATKERVSSVSPLALSTEPAQRTEEYIKVHFDHHQETPISQPGLNADPNVNGHSLPEDFVVERQAPLLQPPQNFLDSYAPPPQASFARPFPHPAHSTAVVEHRHMDNITQDQRPPSHSDISDLTAHLARRDLLTAGLKVFDNRPENYLSWKASFRNVTHGLNLRPSEELDLLTRWLGGESLQHAMRIRAVHINDPLSGLTMVWKRLDKKYGSPEAIEASLFSRLENFPKIGNREYTKLQELADLLTEVKAAKLEGSLPGLSFLDTARGTNPIVQKLPHYLQERWVNKGSQYKKEHGVPFPPFSYFVDFVYSQAEMRIDPSFAISSSTTMTFSSEKQSPNQLKSKNPISVHKTEVGKPTPPSSDYSRSLNPDKQCPIHNKPHSLRKCRGFRAKPLEERKTYLREHAICYRCCASTTHQAKECKATIRCTECDSDRHVSALHDGPPPWVQGDLHHTENHGGEQASPEPPIATSSCTAVCGEGPHGKSCSKICLVNVYPEAQPEKMKKVYVMLDDQSSHSLARSTFFDMYNIRGDTSPYLLRTCSGTASAHGRKAFGFSLQSTDGKVQLSLPPLIECDSIPNNRDEIPTPEAAKYHPHLKAIAHKIPPLDPSAEILLLLGRDVIQAHKVRSQRNGPPNAPYAQRLDLGWVLVGEVCLGGAHQPAVNTFKTNILDNGRPTRLVPCDSKINVKETLTDNALKLGPETPRSGNMSFDIFRESPDDYKLAPSVEDELFLSIMNEEFFKDDGNNWVGPLPFRFPRRRLPNNRRQVLNRLKSLRRTLLKKPAMKEHYVDFMQRIFSNGHAELAPSLQPDQECWYLPSFGVYHSQKPGQIRIVFDSSSQHDNISLNDVLLRGPDLNNTLLGVLIRFRPEPVAVMADIQQMFHSFLVKEEHRDYIRFLWFKDHNLDGEVVDYRMRVHVFGNCPSPAVSIYGLKRTAAEGKDEYGDDARLFVERHFYVDNGLKSFRNPREAVNVLGKAQDMLAQSNLRLHKIASNSSEVMKAFPSDDLAKGLQNLDLGEDLPPMQRSLGLQWDLSSDTFTFQVTTSDKPFTRRGVLSTINSLFDPLGFAAPVSIKGRSILRELNSDATDWDSPLPEQKYGEWMRWRDSLKDLQKLKIPRMYTTLPVSQAQKREVCIFCDASTEAIGAVAYLRVTDANGHFEVGFICGKARLAPKPDTTIPRLELGAAVMAVEIAEAVQDELDVHLDAVRFFTDSKVVLGYITNESRRFYVYVHNRVQRIKRSTQASQWNYVPTDLNPADHATRSLPASHLSTSTWLSGPPFLSNDKRGYPQEETFSLINPEGDVEVRPQVISCATVVSDDNLGNGRFERFSSWKSLQNAVSRLMHITRSFSHVDDGSSCHGWHLCKEHLQPNALNRAKATILHAVQMKAYADEVGCLQNGQPVPRTSPLDKLHPFLGKDGLLRVGGRLKNAGLTTDEAQPVVIPGKCHVARLLIRHYHDQVQHQGRHFTEGAVRAAGFWILGGKRVVNSVIYHCVTCRKLRGKQQEQIMADLPADRLSTDPPFSYVGLDVFGPWSVTARKTRGGHANNKRWAVIFTCMATRAVHIEVIESMDTSSFVNALRRFFALRGPAKLLRSDCGTNFIGACKELGINSSGRQKEPLEHFLVGHGCEWQFNPPHASHMGGSWERMIGIARRILDAMLLQPGPAKLTHEVLTTLMAEVTAIINARPLCPVSTDPDDPFILTPAMLLTQKVGTPSLPPGEFDDKDLSRCQWRRVQRLADMFWKRWKRDYIAGLQARSKWTTEKPNLQEGDVVLLKDSQSKRNDWPMGLINRTFPSEDGRVRKIEVKIIHQGEQRLFLRPVTEVVLLLGKDSRE